MTDERDASEVVTGDEGGGHLVEPSEAEELGADLEALEEIEVDETPLDKTD